MLEKSAKEKISEILNKREGRRKKTAFKVITIPGKYN
jgi:hypothetical protein